TLRKARTGELTPPGMWVWALANRVSERDMRGLANGRAGRRGAARRWESGWAEQLAERLGATLHLGGGVGGEQRVDHRDQTGTGGDQLWRGLQGDAADRSD